MDLCRGDNPDDVTSEQNKDRRRSRARRFKMTFHLLQARLATLSNL